MSQNPPTGPQVSPWPSSGFGDDVVPPPPPTPSAPAAPAPVYDLPGPSGQYDSAPQNPYHQGPGQTANPYTQIPTSNTYADAGQNAHHSTEQVPVQQQPHGEYQPPVQEYPQSYQQPVAYQQPQQSAPSANYPSSASSASYPSSAPSASYPGYDTPSPPPYQPSVMTMGPVAPMMNWPAIVSLSVGGVALAMAFLLRPIGLCLGLVGLGFGIFALILMSKGRSNAKPVAITGAALSALATLVASVFLVIGVTPNSVQVDSTRSAQPTETSASAAASAAPAPLGGSVMWKSTSILRKFTAKVTVSQYKDPATATEPKWVLPDSRVVAVFVSFENQGPQAMDELLSAKIYSDSGQGFSVSSFIKIKEGDSLPISVSALPQGSSKGWVVFNVPKSVKLQTVAMGDLLWKLN